MCASLTRSLKPRPEPFILPPEVHAPASHRVAAKARVGSVDNILPKGEACAACKSRKVRCDAVRPACGACQRTAKFKLRDPNAVVCKYPKRKEPRRLAVKTEDTSESALPHDEQHLDFPVMTSPASYSSASPAASRADSAEACPSPPHTFALPSLPSSADHSPVPTPPEEAIAPVQVPPLYYLSDLGAAFTAPPLSRMPSALPESFDLWPQDLWAESTGLVFDDGFGLEHKGWEVSEIEGELEATLEEWERDHACGQGDHCGEQCAGSEGGFPWS